MATAPDTGFPSWLAREERMARRRPAGVHGLLAGHEAEVLDASPLGVGVRTAAPGGVGAFVTLSVGDRAFSGWVAWRRGALLGIDFREPLDRDALAALTG